MAVTGRRARSNRRRQDGFVFLVLVLTSFFIFFFSSNLQNFKNTGLTVFSVLRNGVSEVFSAASRVVTMIGEQATLRKELAALSEQLTRYEQLERSVAEIRQENARLREQLGFSQSLQYEHIPARLSGRDPNNLFSAFIINKGTQAGVAEDMSVIAYQDGVQGLVGKVVHAGVFESFVMPLYDAKSFVASRFVQSRNEGIAEGQGAPGSAVLMRYIARQARNEINIGDMVVTSGMGGVYPAEINIGRVTWINFQQNELSMEVELTPIVNFSRLEYVFVINTRGEVDG